MTPTTEISHTIQVSMVGMFALAMVFAALVWGAEPELKRQAIINQERNVTWQK